MPRDRLGTRLDAADVSQGVNAMRSPDAPHRRTHYQRCSTTSCLTTCTCYRRLLVRSGGRELALELEEKDMAGRGCPRLARAGAVGARKDHDHSARVGGGAAGERAARFAAIGFPTTRQEEWRFRTWRRSRRASFRFPGRPQHAARWFSVALPIRPSGHHQRKFARACRPECEPKGIRTRACATARATPPRPRQHLGRVFNIDTHPFAALKPRCLTMRGDHGDEGRGRRAAIHMWW